ncbi:phospholipid scramblase 2 [Eurytemora carolleeae]|uniref:phospholipid scramblase 2 n=1 Tax=Eurytemora carolleeae TaxID=1294199 RepID=UPI000C76D285|nr:phospholipid scramblase 2 [Eurytemora carolleeae]|eukprot:XP_023323277.1 phospholipid scramblase 2-like [Eurytemora affinis]
MMAESRGYEQNPAVMSQPTPVYSPMNLGTMVPPGLQYLASLDQLLVKQTVEMFEAFTGFETNNKYKIQNSLGQKIFMAKEDTDCCTRQMCGPARPFEMNICDLTGTEVIHLYRPLACQTCCFPCCLQTLEVHSPPGTIIGTVEQEWSILHPRFVVKDESGEAILRIEGPCWTCSCFGDVEFKVLSATHGTEVNILENLRKLFQILIPPPHLQSLFYDTFKSIGLTGFRLFQQIHTTHF